MYLENIQTAVRAGEWVWEVVKWDKFERWPIGMQMTQSGDSMAVNRVEGYYRYSKRDQKRFMQIALASTKETRLWM
ncbi:four helix bundle protein [candidate division KSB1 bacterium]|nr:four helix bundle protein [candidate division KSB1 bacterium]